MRLFWIAFAFILMLCLVPVSWSAYNNYMVHKYGTLVEVTIIKLPERGFSSKSKGDMVFFYQNREYKKMISGRNNHYVGEKLILRYLNGYEDNFLYQSENNNLGSVISILMILGLIVVFLYYAYKNQSLT